MPEALQLLYIDLFLITQYMNKLLWLILGIEGCFIYLLHKIVVYRHFSYFNMASKMAAKGHVTVFIIVGSN